MVILFVSYFCGGYFAGRMACFNGLCQGVAVWIWAVIVAVVVAILSLILGSKYNIWATSTASRASRSTRAPSH